MWNNTKGRYYEKAREFLRWNNLTAALTLPLEKGVLKTPGNWLEEQAELGALFHPCRRSRSSTKCKGDKFKQASLSF